jgi:hypothetical protein
MSGSATFDGSANIALTANLNAVGTAYATIGAISVDSDARVVASVYTPVNKAGDTMSGALTTPAVNLTNGQLTSASALTAVTTLATTVDTWLTATYRSAKYVVQGDGSGSSLGYQMSEVSVIQDGAGNVYMTEYGQVYTGANPILTISASITSGTLSLTAQSVSGTVNVKFVRTTVAV